LSQTNTQLFRCFLLLVRSQNQSTNYWATNTHKSKVERLQNTTSTVRLRLCYSKNNRKVCRANRSADRISTEVEDPSRAVRLFLEDELDEGGVEIVSNVLVALLLQDQVVCSSWCVWKIIKERKSKERN